MPPAAWTGHLRVGLITIPIRLLRAVSGAAVAAHELGRQSPARAGEPAAGAAGLDLITIDGFAASQQVDDLIRMTPYSVVPQGQAAAEASALLARAMGDAGRIALGRLGAAGAEMPIMLMPRGQQLLLVTLRRPDQIQLPNPNEPTSAPPSEPALALARELVTTLDLMADSWWRAQGGGHQAALAFDGAGLPEAPAATVDLIDALRLSVERSRDRKKPPAGSIRRKRRTRARRR